MQISAQAERTTRVNRVEEVTRSVKSIYLRRSSPQELPELCIICDGQFEAFQLTKEQFRNLTRDSSGMYFAGTTV